MSQTVREIAERLLDGIVLLGLHYDTQMAGDVKALAGHVLASTEPQKAKEWDGAFFCGSCDELLVIVDQAFCHKCGGKVLLMEVVAVKKERDTNARVYGRIYRNASDSVELLEQAGIGQEIGKGNCLVDMVREACGRMKSIQQLADERGREVERLRNVIRRAELPHAKGCAMAALCPCSCGLDAALATPAATPPAQEHPDTARLRWAFGDPDKGATRAEIEHLLVDACDIEEARALIDELSRTAPEAQR